jgi:sulfatase modifying factor 1
MIAIPDASFFLDRTPVTVAAYRASGLSTTAERLGGSVIDLSTGHWRVVQSATYEHPQGPEGNAARDDEPATQISWDDASAFCAARGARLPTEDEWEHAARNGRGDRTLYPWGDDPIDQGRWRLNAWQGAFPTANTLEDGYLFASPVGTFAPTPIGLIDMVGNVWQWTSSAFDAGKRAMRGGSFLCDEAVCHGYRIEARQGATPDSALMHVGFRCAADPR